jgi:hypothetical protein
MVNPCILSSFIFLTNAASAVYFKHFIYGTVFFILALTSIIHHSLYKNWTKLIDRSIAYSIIVIGGIVFAKKILYAPITDLIKYIRFNGISLAIIATFALTVLLYALGYSCNKFCFDTNIPVSQRWHALMHVIASVGHHMIVWL